MRSYSSRFYDQYFVGVEGDVAFYVGHARCSSGPILEVGDGSVDFLDDGFDFGMNAL